MEIKNDKYKKIKADIQNKRTQIDESTKLIKKLADDVKQTMISIKGQILRDAIEYVDLYWKISGKYKRDNQIVWETVTGFMMLTIDGGIKYRIWDGTRKVNIETNLREEEDFPDDFEWFTDTFMHLITKVEKK